MAEYTYTGVDRSGRKVTGQLNAPTEGELRMILRGQGIRPTKIQRSGAVQKTGVGELFKKGGISVPTEILVAFTRQLHVLIGSGIPLVQALEILQEQANNASMKIVLASVREKVSAGSYLWESLSAYPKVFPKLFIALVRAGEASGSLDQMLKRLSRYIEDADRLNKQLKSAMMYPIIVMIIAVGVIALMLIFVIPKFEEMLTQAGQELPAPTKFVIDLSHFMVNNIIVIVVGTTTAIFLLIRYLSSDEGRALRDRVLFTAPLFGQLMQKGGVARFSRTMQTLLASGVNLIDAIDICKATIDNAVLEAAVSKIKAEIEAGKPLGVVVGKLGVFPKMAVQMISVGESTGALDKMLEKVADFYESEVETVIQGLTKLIEPFILVFLGGTVGGLMIAMYLPIFKMAGGAEGQ
jgi:type IV pilus assembly protein PilC